jgi:5-(hydroxymethyl)furfural/furfural oxidase
MTAEFDTIIVGAGAAGCVLANRLSARSAEKVLLLEAGQDTPPGHEPADVLDTYATSYYNDAYFWPGLKVHWRRKDNSPLVGFSQGRIMGGGSSVMGMVAYRGTPDDYAEWEAHGADGWGWNNVLPFYRKLEHDLDFDGELHGKEGPVPIRRTKPQDWAPLSKAVHAFAQERQIPLIADMNGDFRDGYGAVPMSNWPNKRASSAICYLDASVRARGNLTIVNGAGATGFTFEGRRVTGVAARIGGEERQFRAREVILRHPFARLPAAIRHRAAGAATRARHRSARGSPGRRRKPLQPCHRVRRLAAKCRCPTGAFIASAPHDGVPLFLRATRRAADRHVHQCAVQDVVVAARSASGQSRADLAQADGARSRHAPGARRRIPLRGFMQGFRRAVEILAHEKVRAMSGITFPVKFTDRLRRLNRITPTNKLKSAIIARLIDMVPPLAGPIFSTLADRRVDLTTLVEDDDALAQHIRDNVAGTFHPVGTCRMGRADDPDAVVDAAGRVRGIGGLRVVDASIMPTVPRGNTNIPTIMLAEKISAAIADETG